MMPAIGEFWGLYANDGASHVAGAYTGWLSPNQNGISTINPQIGDEPDSGVYDFVITKLREMEAVPY